MKGINEYDDIIDYLVAKYELDSEIVEKIVRSQFKFIKETMEMGDMQSVHLHFFGKIAVKPFRKEVLLEDGYVVKKKEK